MPNFTYSARDNNGKVIEGKLEARDAQAVAEILHHGVGLGFVDYQRGREFLLLRVFDIAQNENQIAAFARF